MRHSRAAFILTTTAHSRLLWAVLLGLALTTACTTDHRTPAPNTPPPVNDGIVDLLGAGATFPYPLYARWFNQYADSTGVLINYQSVGSGSGTDRLRAGDVDFGATDVPIRDAADIVHIPTVLGAVAVTYNAPGLERPLRLSPEVLTDLFLGRITSWSDERLVALNPDVTLPERDVRIVHRSDASGTTFIFTDYLAAISADWEKAPGRGLRVHWPTGSAAQGNAGVAAQVKQVPGSIGYVEAGYARQNRLPIALLKNSAGNFVAPSAFELAAAATSALDDNTDNDDLRRSIVNASGARAYPIASFTWMLFIPAQLLPEKRTQLHEFLQWALRDGEATVRAMGYEALPPALAERALLHAERALR